MKKSTYHLGIYYGGLYGRNKKIKERLVQEYGKCYWCSIKVIIYTREKGLVCPDDEATLDHLKSKIAGRKVGEITPKVLSCRKCNEYNAYKDKLKFNI